MSCSLKKIIFKFLDWVLLISFFSISGFATVSRTYHCKLQRSILLDDMESTKVTAEKRFVVQMFDKAINESQIFELGEIQGDVYWRADNGEVALTAWPIKDVSIASSAIMRFGKLAKIPDDFELFLETSPHSEFNRSGRTNLIL
jgi:hypothetical protein